MKKLFLSAIVTLFMSTAFATVKGISPLDDTYAQTSRELSKLLNAFNSVEELNEEVLVKVLITINESHEIVVLQTNSKNAQVTSYIKNVLNYKKLPSDQLVTGKDYSFTVKFKI